jgi:hypothetical protein
MSIDLPSDLEQALKAQAEQQQMKLDELVQGVLRQYLHSDGAAAQDQMVSTIDPDYFAAELATYDRHKPELERDHLGKFALLRGAELLGIFDRWEDASSEGYKRFGSERFMVHEIGDPEVVMFPGIH